MISTSHFHPMLIHFPIALVAFGFIAETASLFFKKEICLSKIGLFLLLFGTLSAILAWLTGTLFTSEMTGSAGEIKETHELFASVATATLVIASIIRIIKKKEDSYLKWVALLLYGIAALSVSITGFYGGTLVYNYMMPL